MLKKKLIFITLIIFCSVTLTLSQIKKIKYENVEFGLRFAETSDVFHPAVLLLEEDIGIHYFDGFFLRINQSKMALRLGIGYFANNFIFPYYDKSVKGLKFTKTNFLQFSCGVQYKPGKQKIFYTLADLIYSQIKKEGYLYGPAGPILLLNTFRQNFGLAPGFGIKQKFGRIIALSLECHLSILWQMNRAIGTLPYTGEVYLNEEKDGMKFPMNFQLLFTLEIR